MTEDYQEKYNEKSEVKNLPKGQSKVEKMVFTYSNSVLNLSNTTIAEIYSNQVQIRSDILSSGGNI